MKFALVNLALLFKAAVGLVATTGDKLALSAEAQCGELGVMDITNLALPKGVKASDVRACKEHPLLHKAHPGIDDVAPVEGTTDLSPATPLLAKRECWFKSEYGCTDGYCWKVCDKITGKWCWTAARGGAGAWAQCSRWDDCGTGSLNYGCGRGVNCNTCGCDCRDKR